MKNTTTSFIFALFLGMQISYAQTGQFRVNTNDFVQIGYSNYKALTFGKSTADPNNGNWSIEYCEFCESPGFNIWKPWPTAGMDNYYLFIRDEEGNVGIGNSGESDFKLNVSGKVRAEDFESYSDKRFKRNLKPLSTALEKLSAIKPYEYQFKGPKNDIVKDSIGVNQDKIDYNKYSFDESRLHYGFIAQDIAEIYPNLVTKDDKGYLSLNYIEFVPLLEKHYKNKTKKLSC